MTIDTCTQGNGHGTTTTLQSQRRDVLQLLAGERRDAAGQLVVVRREVTAHTQHMYTQPKAEDKFDLYVKPASASGRRERGMGNKGSRTPGAGSW